MIRRVLGGAALSASLLASIAMTQPSSDPRVDARLSGRVRDVVVAMLDSARNDGLPTEPLVQKAFEGVGKGAPSGLIISALRDYLSDLRRARTALGPSASISDVEAGALALRNKIDVRYLERLRATKGATPQLRIATALNVLSYIRGIGVHPDTAANVITSLVLASASDDQLLSLKDDIERDIAGGVSAALALSARGQGLTALIAAAQNNGGAPSGTLPSGLGSTRVGDPGANAAVGGGAAGAVSPGGSKPAPVGRPKKP